MVGRCGDTTTEYNVTPEREKNRNCLQRNKMIPKKASLVVVAVSVPISVAVVVVFVVIVVAVVAAVESKQKV